MPLPVTEELESLRPYLLRYALLQLRDRDSDEDVVQETMLAALEGRHGGYADARQGCVLALRQPLSLASP
jgi:DNA-directed RNA polymerase specialized sigma24 family protein